MSAPLPDADDLQAAEYALGVTDIAARQAAETRAARDPAFAARIADWQAHFAGLNDDFAPAAAPPDLMERVEARLFPRPAQPAPRAPWSWLRGLGPGAVVLGLVAWFLFAPALPEMTATLADQGQGVSWQADLTRGQLTLSAARGPAAPDGKDYELWIIRGSDAPVSLGVLPAAGERLTLPDAALGAVLAVTLEPKGGSPSGKPTGPVVALGPLQKA
jgi:anti-sigma-K factor RskA